MRERAAESTTAALVLIVVLASACKMPRPTTPAPLPATPTPGSAMVSPDDLKAAMLSLEYHVALREKAVPPPYVHVIPLDDAIDILVRDPGENAHLWRQRAVVILATASIERYREELVRLRAPIPQLQMLRREVRARPAGWWTYLISVHIQLIYPWAHWLRDFVGTPTPTPTASPGTPTPTTRTPDAETPTATWTPAVPTATWTPSAIMMAPPPCAAGAPVGTPIFCEGPGVPDAACATPISPLYTGGTWVQAKVVLSVNRPPDYVARILDPQNWSTCNAPFFVRSYVLPQPNVTPYPHTCAEVATPPTPGAPYPYGSRWGDVVYEHFDVSPLGWFKNRIGVKVTTATATAYHYDYELDGAVCSQVGLYEENGGLDVDEGIVDVVGTAASSTITAVKKFSYTDRQKGNLSGTVLDKELYKWGGLNQMGTAMQAALCSCVP